jgi:hypothetical protein
MISFVSNYEFYSFLYYSVTTRFNTIEEIIERGKYIFNKWFDKRWGLSLEKSWSNKTKILIK